MNQGKPMRNFALEVYFSKWEFNAKHNMTASDLESMSVEDLLALGDAADRDSFSKLWLGYTETWGAPELRGLIAGTYDTLADRNILCLAGAAEGLYLMARVLLSADDHVIVPAPNYQSAETVPLSVCEVSGVAMHYDRQASGGWRMDIDDIKAAIRPNTKLLSFNFPHNPTGWIMPAEDLEALVTLCRERGIYIMVDEVYRGVELDAANRIPQIADIYEKGISLGVMSKSYGMPGLRVGWLASRDEELLLAFERYKHYLSICNSGPSEILSMIAIKARDAIFERNRELIRRNLLALEQLIDDFPGLIEWRRSMGGCVAYPKYIGPGGGEEFCRRLIEDSSLLLLPGSIYASEVVDTPQDHFRIGFGRDRVFTEGLAAMRCHFEEQYPNFAR